MDREQAQITVEMLCERRQSDEGKEGMNCFFNKAKPSWVFSVCYKHKTSFSLYDLPYEIERYSRRRVHRKDTILDKEEEQT